MEPNSAKRVQLATENICKCTDNGFGAAQFVHRSFLTSDQLQVETRRRSKSKSRISRNESGP